MIHNILRMPSAPKSAGGLCVRVCLSICFSEGPAAITVGGASGLSGLSVRCGHGLLCQGVARALDPFHSTAVVVLCICAAGRLLRLRCGPAWRARRVRWAVGRACAGCALRVHDPIHN